MGTLVFVCPTTGHQVSTGVELDRSSYKRLPRTKTAIFCPRCRRTICYPVSGPGWTAMTRSSWRPAQSPRLPLSFKIDTQYRRGASASVAASGVAGKKWEVDETKSGHSLLTYSLHHL